MWNKFTSSNGKHVLEYWPYQMSHTLSEVEAWELQAWELYMSLLCQYNYVIWKNVNSAKV